MKTMHERALEISQNYDKLAALALKAAHRFASEGKQPQYDREMARHHKHAKMAIVWYGRAAGIPNGCPY
jgi:hypothetical protein